jgi:hypothetical protein
MYGALLLIFGLMPLLIGVYTWKIVRGREEDGPGDPPPPPEPRRPRPIMPPTLRRRDRAPAPIVRQPVSSRMRVRR